MKQKITATVSDEPVIILTPAYKLMILDCDELVDILMQDKHYRIAKLHLRNITVVSDGEEELSMSDPKTMTVGQAVSKSESLKRDLEMYQKYRKTLSDQFGRDRHYPAYTNLTKAVDDLIRQTELELSTITRALDGATIQVG